ncbi:uncharacterized protein LOC133746077 isoform X2 [Rosa rugosa]|uniref:uncharacterized protein LOC133746077 isoform X2 n=1 Tax=Rosa rugosa TaxID=74645 RepID=UPI002B414736|nr:uncharacterized protein LOC133746077 isoform X2 [Rosa rugosa]XP_062030226.1 uncharacterized protein LOC133746077 isoform X2 [Rosa rugosa]
MPSLWRLDIIRSCERLSSLVGLDYCNSLQQLQEGLMKEMQRSKEGLMKKMQRKKTEVSKLGKLKCRDEHDSVQDVKADDLRQMLLAMTEEGLAVVAILRHFRYPCRFI